jgi:hypothetical protein
MLNGVKLTNAKLGAPFVVRARWKYPSINSKRIHVPQPNPIKKGQ